MTFVENYTGIPTFSVGGSTAGTLVFASLSLKAPKTRYTTILVLLEEQFWFLILLHPERHDCTGPVGLFCMVQYVVLICRCGWCSVTARFTVK